MINLFEKSITRCSLLALLVGGSALSLGGCSTSPTSTPQQNMSSSNDAEWTINHEDWATQGYEWRWTGFPPVQPGAVIQHATAYDDVLIFQGTSTTLSVLETNTGKVRWSRQIDRATTRFHESVLEGDTLFTASDTDLWEFDIHSGNTTDRAPLGTLVNTSPLIMGNLAIFGTSTGELFAWERVNDFKLWAYQFDGAINVPAIKISHDYIGAISEGGEIRTLEATIAHSGMSVKIAGGTEAHMLTDGIGLYIVSKDQSMYAYDVEDGYRYWRKRSSAPISIQHTLYNDIVYATTKEDGLNAINAETGEVLWANPEVHGWAITVIDSTDLIVWSGHELFTVDKDRGDIISKMPLSGIAGIRTNSIDNGDLYVITLDGEVAKFSLK